MNVYLTHGEKAEARWTGRWDTHRRGLFDNGGWTPCCDEGHPDPATAIAHASALEQTRLLRLVESLPADTCGREALDAAS
jgi:hypothetical protein